MEKNTYPSYSIYIQESGQMKKPYSGGRRQIFDKQEALVCACNCWNRYKGHVDVLVLRYDSAYDARIVELINREEKHGV